MKRIYVTVLGAFLLAGTAHIWAKPPAKSGGHQKPADAPSPKPADPWGVALTVEQSPSATVRLECGRKRKDVEAELAKITGKTGMFLLVCEPGDRDESSCINEHFTWRMDFGDVTDVRPYSLLFTHDGRFFGYGAEFKNANFATIFDSLVTRLGEPAVSSSHVHNKAGGTFDQQTALWAGKTTLVKLELIGQDRDTARLTVVYLPIDKELGPKAAPAAPM